jgi:hypothetical protein
MSAHIEQMIQKKEALIVTLKEEIYQLYIDLQKESTEYPVRLERTKLKWVSKKNPETYRVAIVTKNGILQVKAVNDGMGDCCGQRRLKKTFFKNEAEWRDSLDETIGGVSITPPNIKDTMLLSQIEKPLVATLKDPYKLFILESRFPGGIFYLCTETKNIHIKTHGSFKNTLILDVEENALFNSFEEITFKKKPLLMVEYKGHYIGLDHLF